MSVLEYGKLMNPMSLRPLNEGKVGKIRQMLVWLLLRCTKSSVLPLDLLSLVEVVGDTLIKPRHLLE